MKQLKHCCRPPDQRYTAPDGAITTVVEKRRGVGGIALHAEGGLVLSGRDICHVKDGRTRVLFERPEGVGAVVAVHRCRRTRADRRRP